MAEPFISDDELIAWIDGELSSEQAERLAQAVRDDPALAARVNAHRKLSQRMTAAFGPIAAEPVALPKPSAQVISLAEARNTRTRAAHSPRRWAMPGAIAASLVVGTLVGHQATMVASVDDRAGALALSQPVARALDDQLSGEAGPIRVALSFRSTEGDYCRSFAGRHIDGIACRSGDGWQLRYATPRRSDPGDGYRMAGGAPVKAGVVNQLIAGDPLDASAEREARARHWKSRAAEPPTFP